ncbi:MAG: 1-deoxy-D-xylulose-5-phosphate reductoisomerase [bacterium]
MKRISILGSTGSIGTNCLNVVAAQSDSFEVRYLTSYRNIDLLFEQAQAFRPKAVAIFKEDALAEYLPRFRELGVNVYAGFDGILEISRQVDVDIVVNALVGAVGLQPTLNAIRKGVRIALANKETLVIGGQFVMEKAQQAGAEVIPIDSEHSALLQCITGEDSKSIRRIFLTASGGPFRELTGEQLSSVTVEQALNHPNWDMGPKITIDSATLMNKGLEVIEAHWLFNLGGSEIQVVIHPQSIIHSMVEFADGSIKAQLGLPDMRIPIQYALTYPKRLSADFPRLDFRTLKELTFEQPNFDKFRCLKLSYDALESGGAAPAVLNAANEEAVNLFLTEKIAFDNIPKVVEGALTNCQYNGCASIEELLQHDKAAREYVRNECH